MKIEIKTAWVILLFAIGFCCFSATNVSGKEITQNEISLNKQISPSGMFPAARFRTDPDRERMWKPAELPPGVLRSKNQIPMPLNEKIRIPAAAPVFIAKRLTVVTRVVKPYQVVKPLQKPVKVIKPVKPFKLAGAKT